jgi:ABC-type antimicrobial peptide transport system permease subunit
LAASVREEAQRLDPGVDLMEYKTLEEGLGYWSPQNMTSCRNLAKFASVAPIIAMVALLLAAAGLYAGVARSVGQRTKEIGVRMALGAATPEIRRLVLFEGMTPVTVGLVVGLAASLAVNRLLQSQLVGVSPYDAFTLTVGPLMLVLVARVGCLFPLRQAVRVDPVVALRCD